MSTNVIHRPAVPARIANHSLVADLRIAGTLIAVAGAGILMAIITAEALYPAAYSTATNAISDLGGTEPPNSVDPAALRHDLRCVDDAGRGVRRPSRHGSSIAPTVDGR